jgi:hypothetical protein
MFNFVLQFFKVVFNKARSLLIFFILKPQQQQKYSKISHHNMTVPKTQFPFISKKLVAWNQNFFFQGPHLPVNRAECCNIRIFLFLEGGITYIGICDCVTNKAFSWQCVMSLATLLCKNEDMYFWSRVGFLYKFFSKYQRIHITGTIPFSIYTRQLGSHYIFFQFINPFSFSSLSQTLLTHQLQCLLFIYNIYIPTIWTYSFSLPIPSIISVIPFC